MTQWNYLGEVYDGCAGISYCAGVDWCYVQGGSNCITASESQVQGEEKKWRVFSPCNCMTQWSYLGEVYDGCAETSDWAGVDWCYVQGGSNFIKNKPSIESGIADIGKGLKALADAVSDCFMAEFAALIEKLAVKMGGVPEVMWVEELISILIEGVPIELELYGACEATAVLIINLCGVKLLKFRSKGGCQ